MKAVMAPSISARGMWATNTVLATADRLASVPRRKSSPAQQHHGQGREGHFLGLGGHLQPVSAVRMDHLVSHDRSDLGVGLEEVEYPRGEEDESPRQAEGVERLGLDDADGVGKAALHVRLEPVQDHLEPRQDGRVRGERPAFLDLGQGFLADLPFFLQLEIRLGVG